MKVITRKKWLVPNESFVEVRWQPNWTNDGWGKLDVFHFTRDPRKAQYHKPKFWSRMSSHGIVEPNFDVDPIKLSNNIFAGSAVNRKQALAAREIFKKLCRTSSDSRAAAQSGRSQVTIPACGFKSKPHGISYVIGSGVSVIASNET